MILTQLSDIADTDARACMTSLYTRYRKLVFHLIQKWIDDPEEQNDVAQDVWFKLIQKQTVLAALSEPQQASYITCCAKNTALSHLSKAKSVSQKIIVLDDERMEEAALSPSSEEILLLNDQRTGFHQVWARLSERDRFLLESKYLYKASDEDLAARLGCKPGSVRMALTRAKRAAIAELERRQSDEKTGSPDGEI